jgi:phosphoglycerate dehydrogenase-like enzyme
MATNRPPVLVLEDDVAIHLLGVVLDPKTSPERYSAFVLYMSHDLPDFDGWCAQARANAGRLFPADVRFVATQEELLAGLPEADGAVVEGLEIGPRELAAAPQLGVVLKHGVDTRNIDLAACAARGIPVLTLRRRVNIACAEQALAAMLAIAKKLPQIAGLISDEHLRAAGYSPGRLDRRHTSNAGWSRVIGLRTLFGSTLGLVGMGEIGRELAVRCAACGMRQLYYQRRRLPESLEQQLQVEYAPLDRLLEESDWVSVQVPLTSATRGMFNRERLALMKPGAVLIDIARAELIDREALLDALRSGQLGGLALDAQYEEPGRSDDELLSFDGVLLTPHTAAAPRFNSLSDCEEMIQGLATALGLA